VPASLVAALSLVLFFIGYRYYSKYLAEKIYQLDPDFMTPAHEFKDGRDYVPAHYLHSRAHDICSVYDAMGYD